VLWRDLIALVVYFLAHIKIIPNSFPVEILCSFRIESSWFCHDETRMTAYETAHPIVARASMAYLKHTSPESTSMERSGKT
jgi:hypothetical protein